MTLLDWLERLPPDWVILDEDKVWDNPSDLLEVLYLEAPNHLKLEGVVFGDSSVDSAEMFCIVGPDGRIAKTLYMASSNYCSRCDNPGVMHRVNLSGVDLLCEECLYG